MAKEESTTHTDHEEVVVHAPHAEVAYMSQHKPDTRIIVIAVGASMVLFAVGLILGYLLGHQAADNRDGSMMNGNTRSFRYWTQ